MNFPPIPTAPPKTKPSWQMELSKAGRTSRVPIFYSTKAQCEKAIARTTYPQRGFTVRAVEEAWKR